jgi:hypothetical protein
MALLSAGATHNYANIKLVKTKERGAVGLGGGGRGGGGGGIE